MMPGNTSGEHNANFAKKRVLAKIKIKQKTKKLLNSIYYLNGTRLK